MKMSGLAAAARRSDNSARLIDVLHIAITSVLLVSGITVPNMLHQRMSPMLFLQGGV